MRFLPFIELSLLLLIRTTLSATEKPINLCKLRRCTKILINDQLQVDWQYNDEDQIIFTLTMIKVDGSDKWISFGAKSPNNENGNIMTGPPGSIVAFGYQSTLQMYTLNQKDYPMGPESSMSATQKNSIQNVKDKLIMTFTISEGEMYNIVHSPPDTAISLLFAIGNVINSKPIRHTINKGINIILYRTNATVDDASLSISILDKRTLRMYHGAALTFIWGFCTIVGAGFARYCRHKWYWFPAHKGCQSMGGLLTIPLTFLAYYTKATKHYSWMHGTFGLFLGIASTIQGLLGTLTVRSHNHWFGWSNRPSVDHLLRIVHRILGKVLLFFAFVQIMLGRRNINFNSFFYLIFS